MIPQPPPGLPLAHDKSARNWRLTGPQAAIGIAQLRKIASGPRPAPAMPDLVRSPGGGASAARTLPGAGLGHAWYNSTPMSLTAPKRSGALLAPPMRRGFGFFPAPSEVYLEAAFDDLPAPTFPSRGASARPV